MDVGVRCLYKFKDIVGAASAEGTSQLGFIQFDENVFLD